jgi:two-component system chemotaxis response regulator CheB
MVATPKTDAVLLVEQDIDKQMHGERTGQVSVFSCPDCGGVLWQVDKAGPAEFRCHVGHEFGADKLVLEKSRALEQAIFEAIRVLKEKSILLRQLATLLDPNSPTTAYVIEQADQDVEHARLLQTNLIDEGGMSSIDTAADLLSEIAREIRRPPDD